MEKKLVLNQVISLPSSIFSKRDVVKLIYSIDENPIKVYQMEVKPEPEMVSLFDFLGHAAGAALGAAVYGVARRNRENVETRIVETKTYKGKVMLYRKAFLNDYFKSQRI
tara:strand:- start:17 stop:346 length:330 start_codon:yes stop_codon:yes gene_type:complete